MIQPSYQIHCYIAFWLLLLSTSCQKIPVIERFSGNKGVLRGNESSLSWEVKNSEKITIKNDLTGESFEYTTPKGRFKFKPEEDFSYTLTARNTKGQEEQKTITGKILPNPPIIEYFRGSTEYKVGDTKQAYLEWQVYKAERVYLRHIAEEVPSKMHIKFAPDSTYTYELVAIGAFGDTTSRIHTIKVNKPNYKINVDDAGFGTSSLVMNRENTLSWNFTGAEWVVRAVAPKDTLSARDSFTLPPFTEAEEYFHEEVFYVKYPSETDVRSIKHRFPLEQYKVFFKPSLLRAEAGSEVFLNWRVYGVKEYSIWVDGLRVAKGGDKEQNKYAFIIRKNTSVQIKFTDYQNQSHTKDWTIKSGQFRPFIVNAIDYSTIKNEIKPRRIISEVFYIDRSKYPNQITLRILVTDTLGNFIKGLAPPTMSEAESRRFFKAIIERSGNQTQSITDFSIKEVHHTDSKPYDVALSLDYSGSMAGAIYSLESAVRRMLNKKSDEDRFSIIRFDHELKTEALLTKDANTLLNSISWKGLGDFGGATALYAGADEALISLANSPQEREKILFLFTDGYENSSFSHAEKGRVFRATELAKKAREMGVRIFPISFGDNTNEKLLNALGWLTDGNALQVFSNAAIDSVYAELPYLFRNYYEITYKPMADKDPSGQKQVGLKYFNQKKDIITKSNYQTHDNFEIDEETGENFLAGTRKNTKQILTPPQAVAFFGFDRANLDMSYTPALNAVYVFLKKNPQTQIDILGHTDLVGTEEKNVELSKRRAEAVKQYLLQKGITANRMHILALGKSKPVWRVEDEEWKAKENRRIEIQIWQ